MFGYIIANKPELKIKEYEIYQSYYCGLCKALGKNGGHTARLSLSYDMTFVYIVLSALYEPKEKQNREHCILHPVTGRMVTKNEIADYVADMSLLMTYLKGRDDWKDRETIRKSIAGRLTMDMTEKSYKRIRQKYKKKVGFILSCMKRLDQGEKAFSNDIDCMAGAFGDIMGEVFCMNRDMWEQTIRKMGFYLGKFIYLMDAYEDIEEDIKTKNYNPFFDAYKRLGKEMFDEYAKKVLLMMMADCTKEFERLPIVENAELIRNILYAGVWTKLRRKNIKDKGEASDIIKPKAPAHYIWHKQKYE